MSTHVLQHNYNMVLNTAGKLLDKMWYVFLYMKNENFQKLI
jgi:hypothetical protein